MSEGSNNRRRRESTKRRACESPATRIHDPLRSSPASDRESFWKPQSADRDLIGNQSKEEGASAGRKETSCTNERQDDGRKGGEEEKEGLRVDMRN
ncbi:hypothetical protein IEQ34_006205 [Dendrobium chrysotoxum]|uniref:Uncharacterized protein n=1 Tax=Dendrobium chrysotoxum TaxID=161865 RepID=A0AAV7HC87_DENCH|nr:hypothetical protein IEQ34_006205 [Dendrobium chrysotoxum]